MKIINLAIENFMKLVAVEITPDGNTVLITGKNGAGKSCVLDAIISALQGKKYTPQRPVQDGADHAEVRIETENYIIKRTFTPEGGGTLSITNAEGMRAASPQELLSKIVGEIAFNPGKFIRLVEDEKGRREQKEILMKLAGLDFSDIDTELDDIKEKRSAAKFRKENAEHNVTAPNEAEKDLPAELVSIDDLTLKLATANKHNESLATLTGKIADAGNAVANTNKDIEAIETNIAGLESQIADLKTRLIEAHNAKSVAVKKRKDLTAKLDPIIDTVAIQAAINKAHETNRLITNRTERKELLAAVEVARKEFSDLGNLAKEVEGKKAKRLAEAKMPIDGLGVDENGITYKGIPFSQTNMAKQLEIAVAIGMAMNPKLKVILMDGNSLDSTSLAAISKLCKDKDWQVWVEKCCEDSSVGIYIEDGSVKK